jgi:hypothetical protein
MPGRWASAAPAILISASTAASHIELCIFAPLTRNIFTHYINENYF